MRLADLLDVSRITVRLAATAKPDVLRELAELFTEDGGPGGEAIAQVFADREALASTGIGSGVAVPHGRMAGVETLRAAVALAPEGVDFEAIDGRPVHILVAVLGPDRQTGDHLKALARFSRLLRSARNRDRLLAAADAAAALEIIVQADG